jgi:hypothetical protein
MPPTNFTAALVVLALKGKYSRRIRFGISSVMTDQPPWDTDADSYHTAFEKRSYKPVFFKAAYSERYSVREAYYEASHDLIVAIAEGSLRESVKGVAAVYLFRHYLELSLKRIILEGRWLKSEDENARREDVAEMKRTHKLGVLWNMVLADARSKIKSGDWKGFDIDFIKRCIDEFDAVDPNGEAYRYADEGAENYLVSFGQLAQNMGHIHTVFEAIISWLVETYGQNQEWETILNSF